MLRRKLFNLFLTGRLYNNVCFALNRIGLSRLVALARVLLHMLLAPFAYEERYACPDGVGYTGWVEVPRVGVLAFRKPNGKLQYRW